MNGDNQCFQLLSEKSLAEILDVSTRTLRTWRMEGRLPYIRISAGTVRYDLAEVMAALDEKKVNARRTRRLGADDE
ncbi:MAG: helix-turn-helix domain-containing protein [Verrucomicrobiae bacterium]|nr:helix-turn-helix domain-containing protein [Verrucomicrobiae bacterium]